MSKKTKEVDKDNDVSKDESNTDSLDNIEVGKEEVTDAIHQEEVKQPIPPPIPQMNSVEILTLRSEIEEMAEQLEFQKKQLQSEKKHSQVYTRFFHQMKGIITKDQGMQTEDKDTADYLFFQEIVDKYLQECLLARKYKVVTPDFKLKGKQKRELMMSFFKFKMDTKKMVQNFIDKYEMAHQIKNDIQKFTLIREEEEKQKVDKDNSKLEQEKEKILNQLQKWNNDDKDKAQKNKVSTDIDKIKEVLADNTSENKIDSSTSVLQFRNEPSVISDSSYIDEATPIKRPLRRDILLRKNIKPMRKQTLGNTSIMSNSKRNPSISLNSKQNSFSSSKKVEGIHSVKKPPIKKMRKFTEDKTIRVTEEIEQQKYED